MRRHASKDTKLKPKLCFAGTHLQKRTLLTHFRWVDSSQCFGPVYFQQQGFWLVLLLLHVCFIEIPAFNANSVDPDQMLHSAASNLGLHHLLQITLLWVSGLKWVRMEVSASHFERRPFQNRICFPGIWILSKRGLILKQTICSLQEGRQISLCQSNLPWRCICSLKLHLDIRHSYR